LLAIALMVGFYAFAITIAAALIWIPYAEWRYVGRLDLKLAAFSLGGGFTVLWAITPRFDTFVPPGPRIDHSAAPRLLALVTDVATTTRQAMPSEVYLVDGVNAWVTQRGGIMGFGSRRVMGIGVPLLQGLSQSEFKAVIGHEFGHYSSGDVGLGPWIYKTRAALARALASVKGTLIEAPFEWYGQHFLRLTHAVSRQQELVADEVGAGIAGVGTMASALCRVSALGAALAVYRREELVPVMNAGFLPPIASGFVDFIRHKRIRDITPQDVPQENLHRASDVFDTHPSLGERLAALRSLAGGQPPRRTLSGSLRSSSGYRKVRVGTARPAYRSG
jgi:Zn-dependent protease with chaperone function